MLFLGARLSTYSQLKRLQRLNASPEITRAQYYASDSGTLPTASEGLDCPNENISEYGHRRNRSASERKTQTTRRNL